ncbi:hypothetical protein D6_00397 [Faustovirus]|nr:hypothetical protein D6_00397 [Faustovirus]AMP44071.1 hypothetical protein PRJ_Dakar_00112 [Faustovirus]
MAEAEQSTTPPAVVKPTRGELFAKFATSCSKSSNANTVAYIYASAKDKYNIIDDIYIIVNKTPSTSKYNNHPRWEYKNTYFAYLETISTGVQYIYVRSVATDAIVFIFVNAKFYNKNGDRVYYGRSNNHKLMDNCEPWELIANALRGDLSQIRQFVFNELGDVQPSELTEHMKRSNYTIEIKPVKYCIPSSIECDFTIKHGDQQFKVHKIVAACFSDFLCKLIYGTGDIKGVDSIDLSAFNIEVVEWLARLVYNPCIQCGDLDDDHWALLNYLNVNVDELLLKACRDLYIIM